MPKGPHQFPLGAERYPGRGDATADPLFSEGVVKGRIDLSYFVRITATNHAKAYR